jgi:hypothetical protein
MEYNVEIEFSKNRHYPDFGSDAYSVESHRVKLSYGKNGIFKTSKDAVKYAKSKITEEVFAKYSAISIWIVRGGSGRGEYLKSTTIKSTSTPIDKEFANALFK